MSTDTWVTSWFEAGKAAWREGKKRTDYPFKKALRRSGLDAVWQTGWDTGAMLHAVEVGARARRDDTNPYTDPELAACWTRGWNATHGLSVIGGKKNPASREPDAKPGVVQP